MTETNWVLESPKTQVEGEAIQYSITFLGANELSSYSMKVYRGNNDVSSSALISGDSMSDSKDVLTLKKITSYDGTGGRSLIVAVTVNVDGNTEIRKLEIIVTKPEDSQ
jgi:hypothetical protein